MLLLLGALLLQIQVGSEKAQKPAADSARPAGDSLAVRHERSRRHLPVTDALRTSAFRSPFARTLLLTARVARLRQDSALLAYDTKVFERVSAGLSFSRAGRERLIFRHEDAARVRWSRGAGAWVDVTGARTVSPLAALDEEDDDLNGTGDRVLSPVPYIPGREELLFGHGRIRKEVTDDDLVHPLAEGAEAYYTYEAGDSVRFRLPDGAVVRLRELRVRPRTPRWDLVVGSLWFDVSTGQLVRAAYRLSVPMDIWEVAKADDPTAKDEVPKWLDPVLTPMVARVSAIGIEYGLYQGRFWLPRARVAEGDAQVGFMHVPFKFEQRFAYGSVNVAPDPRDSLPRIVAPRPEVDPDSLAPAARQAYRDSVRLARKASRDSIEAGLKPRPGSCMRGYHTMTRDEDGERTVIRVPCDTAALSRSADLPPSPYDAGEDVYGADEIKALVNQALTLGAQPRWSPQPPVIHWGLDLMRYNRVEGFSAGISVTEQLGAGYSAQAIGRLGTADLEPNVELTLSRSNLLRTVRLSAYNRLVAANDWGNPLGFGSSLGALLFGRDEGFYYRASGAELGGTRDRTIGGLRAEWRLFAEQERTARQETDFALAGDFVPNIAAARGLFAGAGLRLDGSYGSDPNGTRLFTDLRLEGAGGDTARYGRGALDLTLTQGLGRIGTALTVAGGSTVGTVPPQRLWYLGGTQTVRGQRPGAARGDAFWLARAEVGTSVRAVRPVLFGDLGWAGDRHALSAVGRPASGVGVGASVLDGLIRFDVARGIYPERKTRVNLYVEGKF